MLGNFTYCNPTKLYFGEDSLSNLKTELKKYGTNVVLVYGGGSIKKNGIYDQVMAILNEEGKNVAEIAGVMPNPTVEKLYEGVELQESIMWIFCLPLEVVQCATMLRLFQFQLIVTKTLGKNIILNSKSQLARQFL